MGLSKKEMDKKKQIINDTKDLIKNTIDEFLDKSLKINDHEVNLWADIFSDLLMIYSWKSAPGDIVSKGEDHITNIMTYLIQTIHNFYEDILKINSPVPFGSERKQVLIDKLAEISTNTVKH